MVHLQFHLQPPRLQLVPGAIGKVPNHRVKPAQEPQPACDLFRVKFPDIKVHVDNQLKNQLSP